jgi:hypothetical protein
MKEEEMGTHVAGTKEIIHACGNRNTSFEIYRKKQR